MKLREWTIQTSNNKGLCLTRLNLRGRTVSFTKCAFDNKNQLWRFRDFTVASGGGCKSTANSIDYT